MKKRLSTLLLPLSLCAMTATAQNPIVQTCFTTDPAPMVHNGRVYVYTGHDENKADFFWMQEWRVYSSDDMVNWTDHGSPIAIEDFTWGDDRAWASQCIERNGKFYWYICLHSKISGGMAIGVAVADNPAGPFKDALGKPLYEDGSWEHIDPTVMIDDDGTAHLYWGNPRLHHAVLADDMIHVNKHEVFEMTEESFGPGHPSRENPDKRFGTTYTEGPWIMKRTITNKGMKLKNKTGYYMLYAAGGIPEHIGYSMSTSPNGPWKYVGQIMPEGGTGSFTNHCGVANFQGHDYFFYHTGWLPEGGGFGRSMCVEEFKFNADGTFPTIRPTREGVKPLKPFSPYQRVQAETMAYSQGVTTSENDGVGVYVSDVHNGDWVKLQNVEFDGGSNLKLRAASGLRGGQIEMHLDSIHGPLVATVEVGHTAGWEYFETFSAPLKMQPTGTHDVYFLFTGRKGPKLFNIDWWELSK